jgi:hypothetical protein
MVPGATAKALLSAGLPSLAAQGLPLSEAGSPESVCS